MAVCFNQGQELTRGDLDLFLKNASGKLKESREICVQVLAVGRRLVTRLG